MIGSWRRPALIGACAVVGLTAVAAGPTLVAHFTKGKTTPELATVTRQSFPVVATASGTLVPASQVALNFQITGQVTQINVSVGDHVSSGEVIAKVDDSSQQANLQSAQAAVNAAEQAVAAAGGPDPGEQRALRAAVAAAQAAYNQIVATVSETETRDSALVAQDNQRMQADCGQSSTSSQCQADRNNLRQDEQVQQQDALNGQAAISSAQSRLAIAESNANSAAPNGVALANAETALSNAQAQLQRAQAEEARTTLVAPTEGTVLSINGQVGETVSAGSTSTPTLPGSTGPQPGNGSTDLNHAFVVLGGGGTRYQVAAPFSQSDVVNLKGGQAGDVTFDAIPGLAIPCHLVAVAGSTTLVNGVSEYYASVSLDRNDPRLRIGMTATVNISVAQANNVVAVPNQAIYTLSNGPHVDVWYQQRAVPTPVQVGLIGSTYTQITSGVSAGEQVVLSTQNPNTLPTVVPAPIQQTASGA